jgi:tetratricopeptide (TPR) repeat protein
LQELPVLEFFRFRLILWLTIALGLLAGCDLSEYRAAAYLDKGRDLYEAGDYQNARLELKSALRINPRLPDAWYLLGRIAQQERDWQLAFSGYGKALEIDPDHIDSTVDQGTILLAAGNPEAARRAVDKALNLDRKHAGALLLRASLESRAGDMKAARATVQEALAADPTSDQPYAALAVALAREGLADDAEKVLLDGLTHSPDSVRLRALLANLYRGEKKPEDEVRLRREIAEQLHGSPAAVFSLVQTLAGDDKVDEAEQVLRERIAAHPDEIQTRLVLVELLRQRRSPEAAEAELLTQIDALGEPEELQLALARLYVAEKRLDAAKAVFHSLIERRGIAASGLAARKGLAGMLLSEGDKEGAARLIAEVLGASPTDGDALIARATLSLADKDLDGAIADLRSVAAGRPASLTASQLLVRAYLAKGDAALALDQLERFVRVNPAVDAAALQLAGLYARLGRVEDAEAQLQEIAERGTDKGAALSALAQLYLKTNRPQRAVEAAETLRSRLPEDPSSHYLLGLARQVAGDHTLAVTAFEAALELQPGGIRPLEGLVRSRLALSQPEEALSTLDAIIEKNAQNFVALNLRGEVLSLAQQPDGALAAFEQASAVRPDWAVPYLNRARLLQGQKRVSEAETALREGVKATQETQEASVLVLRLAALRESQGDRDGAIELYRSLLVKSPDLDVARERLAVLLAEDPKDDEALAEALEVAQRFKESRSPLHRDILGWILYKIGQPGRAIPHLEAAAAGASERPDVLYHLAMAYKAVGRTIDAKQQLERAAALDVDLPERALAKKALAKL